VEEKQKEPSTVNYINVDGGKDGLGYIFILLHP